MRVLILGAGFGGLELTTRLSDAERNGHTQIVELIRQAAQPDEGKVAS